MERVVVFGGYDFIGHHMCVYLINEGIETIINDKSNLTTLQIERFDQIGRNALLIRKESLGDIEEPIDAVYFLLYGSKWNKRAYKNAIKLAEEKDAKLIIIAPIQDDGCIFTKETISTNSTVIKIPYVYGPLSEEDCLLYQMLMAKVLNKEVQSNLSYPCYLYVEDLVAFLYQVGIQEKMGEKIIYYLTNEDEQLTKLNNWFGLESKMKMPQIITPNNKIIECNNCLGITEGLAKTEIYVKQSLKIK